MKIVQITDSHLFATDEAELFGVPSNQQFQRVIDDILITADVDYLFFTGDISQDESEASYHYAAKVLAPVVGPIYWIPGNHDQQAYLQSVFSTKPNLKSCHTLDTSDWRFIFLNSNLAGSGVGFLAPDQLQILAQGLNTQKNTAVVMHHHPMPVGSRLMDDYILKNTEEFWQLAHAADLIICGHVHGDYSLAFGDVKVEAGPSTCYQIKKGASELQIEKRSGYKIFEFTAHGYNATTIYLNT